jgi:hypothetical protein
LDSREQLELLVTLVPQEPKEQLAAREQLEQRVILELRESPAVREQRVFKVLLEAREPQVPKVS